MADLEQLGLIYAPHTSAGRLPTELGLRFFVDALMQIGDLSEGDRRQIEAQVNIGDRKPSDYLRHFYYDTCVFDAPALAALFKRVGADRILLGADYPVGDDDPVGVVKGAVTLSNADLQMVAGGTAARLLGIGAAQKPQGLRSA
jgi:hypothetical protein